MTNDDCQEDEANNLTSEKETENLAMNYSHIYTKILLCRTMTRNALGKGDEPSLTELEEADSDIMLRP